DTVEDRGRFFFHDTVLEDESVGVLAPVYDLRCDVLLLAAASDEDRFGIAVRAVANQMRYVFVDCVAIIHQSECPFDLGIAACYSAAVDVGSEACRKNIDR